MSIEPTHLSRKVLHTKTLIWSLYRVSHTLTYDSLPKQTRALYRDGKYRALQVTRIPQHSLETELTKVPENKGDVTKPFPSTTHSKSCTSSKPRRHPSPWRCLVIVWDTMLHEGAGALQTETIGYWLPIPHLSATLESDMQSAILTLSVPRYYVAGNQTNAKLT